MDAVTTAGAGFLLAVLWFDLMFDVQTRPFRTGDLPEAVLGSIAGYYRRVTTQARPMNRLIAFVMLATLVAIGAQFLGDDTPGWVSVVSAVTALVPIGLAGARTVPNAVRLGSRQDTVDRQSALARSVYRDHRLCIVSITALLVAQIGWA